MAGEEQNKPIETKVFGLREKVINGLLEEIESGKLQFNIEGKNVIAIYNDNGKISRIPCGKVVE